ncbi:hypothetical protein E4U35_002432 [Claviceps purpurea]|nr:hypothetical protein E4U35_002432 [Claviceps purpurea]
MALHPPPSAKLIFAPAGSSPHGQAEQFTKSTLSKSQLSKSPTLQFNTWFADAQSQSSLVPHPETCALSTAELPSGRVSSRMVYLKELDSRGGYVIYSNFGTSRKAADLATNPHAALVFHWEALQRQVRVEGVAERYSREESQVYFDTRVRGSRIGAWASRQSEVLEPRQGRRGGGGDGGDGEQTNGQREKGKQEEKEGENDDDDDGRAQLEEWVKEVERKFEGEEEIPVPEFWGGLRIVPTRVEFWQGRESRLHDRFVYERKEGRDGKDEEWTVKRLSP